jgi:hypothetical protein
VARTRARRRRRSTLLTVAVVITLLVLIFARDVTRSAHGARGPRRSENRSFARLANGLIERENQFDAHLAYLLTHGQGLTRPVFGARLAQLAQQLPLWVTDAELVRRPVLAHHVNRVLYQLTEQRVDDFGAIIDAVALSLHLPLATLASTPLSAASAQASLVASDATWSVKRWSLAREPGRVKLPATTSAVAALNLSAALSVLDSSPTLALTRGIGIAAVEVTPSPLPSPAGQLLLPPVTSVQVGVSVRNGAYDTQPVTLTVTFTPRGHGASQRQVLTSTLGPLQSYAFLLKPLSTTAAERGTLAVAVGGAPAAPRMARSRVYQVRLSPSGAG